MAGGIKPALKNKERVNIKTEAILRWPRSCCFLQILIRSSDISAGNRLTGIAGRLGHEVIAMSMNYNGFTDNFINSKSSVKESRPCIALIG